MKGGARSDRNKDPGAGSQRVAAWGEGVMVAGVIWKDCQQPLDSEMINHFGTKEHKGRFVKNKRGTECQLQG